MVATSHLHQILQLVFLALGPRNLRELDRDPLRGHGPAGGGSVLSSSGCCRAALQNRRNGHAGRRLQACGDEQDQQDQGASARYEVEKVSGPRARTNKKANTRTRRKDARISRASPKESPATSDLHPLVEALMRVDPVLALWKVSTRHLLWGRLWSLLLWVSRALLSC